jgi:hypothetical protein
MKTCKDCLGYDAMEQKCYKDETYTHADQSACADIKPKAIKSNCKSCFFFNETEEWCYGQNDCNTYANSVCSDYVKNF